VRGISPPRLRAIVVIRPSGTLVTVRGISTLRRSAATVIACLATAAAVPAAAAAAPQSTRLSDERTFTRSAGVRREAIVRRSPFAASKPVARLRHRTEDGFPEVYLLLREHVRANGRRWIRIRLPGRPNGRTGWVPADALDSPTLTHWALEIDRRRLRARLFYNGRPRWSAPVGVGRPGMATPAGRFWIREVFPVASGTIYGPWAFGTSAYSALSEWPGGGVVGIHGTNEPALVPGRPSHGCVRLRNRDIRYLARHLPVGAPVRIR
jgi:lipoprotein-anchoring transpeptidase ErfK/SrfK